jgi:hypothetical protein
MQTLDRAVGEIALHVIAPDRGDPGEDVAFLCARMGDKDSTVYPLTPNTAAELGRFLTEWARRHRPSLNNTTASEGASRCECGCKYWENDRCVDCGTRHDRDRHDG